MLFRSGFFFFDMPPCPTCLFFGGQKTSASGGKILDNLNEPALGRPKIPDNLNEDPKNVRPPEFAMSDPPPGGGVGGFFFPTCKLVRHAQFPGVKKISASGGKIFDNLNEPAFGRPNIPDNLNEDQKFS